MAYNRCIIRKIVPELQDIDFKNRKLNVRLSEKLNYKEVSINYEFLVEIS
ncbi:hypothetical protein JCM16774_1305 [Pseudoleptotrichia goodfellowii]|uniref:Uncharacterized protein n=1 Tax=Pseudoleptotrichia goodfellowii TaxID=157692 RepID=A0A510JEA3_9FUSO|nr:hypothetical protein JCM16774_1305 [Pseudoleptotrichia goodfellowii]